MILVINGCTKCGGTLEDTDRKDERSCVNCGAVYYIGASQSQRRHTPKNGRGRIWKKEQ